MDLEIRHVLSQRGRHFDRYLLIANRRLDERMVGTEEPVDHGRLVMLDPARSQFDRAAAGELLSVARDGQAVQALLRLFFEQTEKDDLYTTALTLESLNDRRVVQPLIHVLLEDDNPHRRRAAG